MSINVVRTGQSWWVEHSGRAIPFPTSSASTAELLKERDGLRAAAEEMRAAGGQLEGSSSLADLALLSPLTTPCRVVAQMVNYRSHARDSGFDPAKVQPTFFRKASGSVAGPNDQIVRPRHVRLLDYEVELGLVMGAELPVGAVVEDGDLARYVAGLVLANDVSARDVQLSKGQFYESKSYPTFTPVGPKLVLLEPGEFNRLDDLRLQLSVNDVLRQDRTVTDMIARPAEALSTLARFQRLDPGDLLLPGTPGGSALKAPPAIVERLGGLLPADLKWRIFFRRQAGNPAYLQDGDVIRAQIATADGALDLGSQLSTVSTAG